VTRPSGPPGASTPAPGLSPEPIDRDRLLKLGEAHFWPARRVAGSMAHQQVIARAKGIWLEADDGARLIELVCNASVGHGRADLVELVSAQLLDVASSTCAETVAPITLRFSAALAAMSPDPKSRVFLTSGGSEAVETALKLALQFHVHAGQGGRTRFVALRDGLHGATLGALALTGGPAARPFERALAESLVVAAPDPASCSHCRGRAGCDLGCARELDALIRRVGPETIAGFIAEPIGVVSGRLSPPDDYWPAVREICDRHGILLIADETFSGAGRSGRYFALEHWGVTPDVIVAGKTLSAGYAPLGAAIARQRVADAFTGPPERAFNNMFTFGGNAGSSAAGWAALELLHRERLLENATRMGERLLEGLTPLRRLGIVGQVRGGKGLITAITLVRDKQTEARFPLEADLRGKLRRAMLEHGLLGTPSDLLRIMPALCITASEIDELVRRVGLALEQVSNELA
jgi:adenosylmethionine-8-amino-7-oxononanoate aminotransferase